MTLLEQVSARLSQAGIRHALIGAAALATYGVSRSTLDQDLLAIDRSCLDVALWEPLRAQGIQISINAGDAADPLAGVVRFQARDERTVDLVIGKPTWQSRAIERAEAGPPGLPPVVRPADFILLKLYAGGPQDAWDIQQLLGTAAGAGSVPEVERELSALPPESVALWRRVREGETR